MTSLRSPDMSDDARTSDAVTTQLGTSLYVEAGAGTGKTHQLVTRLTELLACGDVKPAQVAAITFTRAAAFEMRSRVRAALEERAREEPDPQRQTHLDEVLESLDSATIQTIHSFALSMLEERPLDAGLPPVVTPMDEIEAEIYFDERWREWLDQRLESDVAFTRVLARAHRLGVEKPLESLRTVAEQFTERRDLLEPGMFAAGETTEQIPVSHLAKTLEEIKRLCGYCTAADDRLLLHVTDQVVPAMELLLTAAGSAGQVSPEELIDLPKFGVPSKTGRQQNWQQSQGGAEAQECLKDILNDLQAEVEKILDSLRAHTTSVLVAAAADFVAGCAEERRKTGRPTFHDQLVWARDLLRDSPEASKHFKDRYRFILVDEFQDTDPLQIEILRRLTSSDDGAIRPGSLFLVGDPKQSIYRFRGADPEVAKRLSDDVAAAYGHLPLRKNRRSLSHVLEWVNGVFGPWMAASEADGQARYEALTWDEQAAETLDGCLPGAVWWFGEETGEYVATIREREFSEIAAIARAAGAGAFLVRDGNGGWRKSTFGDVAVLIKTRTGVDLLEEALTSANVPFVFQGESPLFTSQDVRDLHNCLTAIDDPADEVAVVAALRSPAFSCSDVDLWRWKQAGGSFFYLDDAPAGASGPVATAFTLLKEYHNLSRSIPVPRLVEQFVRDRRLREKAVLSRKGPERLRRLNMLIELATVLSADEPVTLREFADWLERQSEDNARMPETVSEAVATDAVKVMTIHGAKGLEFPIIIMASASSKGSNSNPVVQWHDSTGKARLEVQLGKQALKMCTKGFAQAREKDAQDSRLEDVRLLYVAATRARDHLLVSRRRKTGDKAVLVAQIEEFLQDRPDLWTQWVPTPAQQAKNPGEAPVVRTAADRKNWLDRREELMASSRRRGYATATGLKGARALVQPLPKEESDAGDSEPGRFGRGAAELGRAVHAVLQHALLSAGPGQDLSLLAQRMADAHSIADRASEVESLARDVLNTGTMKRVAEAAKNGRAWREVRVAAPLSALRDITGELEGQIDLIFEEPGSRALTIVDYKTDRVDGRDVAEAASAYLPQMGAYAWATECVTKRPVTAAIIIFARLAASDATAEYAVPDLQHWKEEAARLAAEQVSAVTPDR